MVDIRISELFKTIRALPQKVQKVRKSERPKEPDKKCKLL
jgi:hypothetical protein